jgi:hypothetical protein
MSSSAFDADVGRGLAAPDVQHEYVAGGVDAEGDDRGVVALVFTDGEVDGDVGLECLARWHHAVIRPH